MSTPRLKSFMTENGEVRHFQDSTIQRAVEDALRHVSKDNPVAVVGHITQEGWKLSAAVRIGNDWSVMAAAYKDWRKPNFNVAGEVVWTP